MKFREPERTVVSMCVGVTMTQYAITPWHYQIISFPFGESHIHEYHLPHSKLCPWSCCMILSTLPILWSAKQQSPWLPPVWWYCNNHLVWWNLSYIHGDVVFNIFSQLIMTLVCTCVLLSVCLCVCVTHHVWGYWWPISCSDDYPVRSWSNRVIASKVLLVSNKTSYDNKCEVAMEIICQAFICYKQKSLKTM